MTVPNPVPRRSRPLQLTSSLPSLTSLSSFLFLLLLLSISILPVSAQQPILIGALSERQHDVSGTLYAIDTRTLLLVNPTYDGDGPAGVFWANLDSPRASSSAGRLIPFKDTCIADPRLPAYDGSVNITLELPADLTLSDVRYFSMWCRAVSAEFGGVEIPDNFVEDNNVPELRVAKCADPDAEEMSGLFPVNDGWNCEALSPRLQARWNVMEDEDEIQIELVARIRDGQYVGFGPSGADTFTQMIGSDVVIAAMLNSGAFASDNEDNFKDAFSIVDYSMTDRSQCSAGRGVCADTDLISTDDGTNSISGISANYSKGVARFVYTRPLGAADTGIDRPIVLSGESFVSWALGPYAGGEPNFHPTSADYPQRDDDGVVRVMIEWGRPASNGCPVFIGSDDDDGDDDGEGDGERIPGFVRPTIANVSDVTARIGPSGGIRGVGALDPNGTAWGIAWYLSPTNSDNGVGTLIPAMAVERGQTYTFRARGGFSTATEDGHPFYITSSAAGGYADLTPQQRTNERVYAGIDVLEGNTTGVFEFNATAQGVLCQLTSTEVNTDNLTWTQYKASISRCDSENDAPGQEGVLTWTVPDDAEDIVFYQCVTHRFLGFRIVVFDQGAVDLDLLTQESGGGPLPSGSGNGDDDDDDAKTCTPDGGVTTFGACELERFAPLQVFYSVDESGNTVDTLVRVPADAAAGDRYLAFAWGFDSMVTNGSASHVVVGSVTASSSDVTMYSLTERTPSGVRQLSSGLPTQVTNTSVVVASDDANGGPFLTLRYMRPLVVDISNDDESGGNSTNIASLLPLIAVADGVDVPFIWATGATSSDTSSGLTPHATSTSSRGAGVVNLQTETSTGTISGRTVNLNRLRIHGILMTTTWALLVPLAVLIMRYGHKWNPIAFNVHRTLNSIGGAAFTIAAFFLAFFSSPRIDTGEAIAHRIIGYFITGFAVVQTTSGWLRPHKDEDGPVSNTRRVWYIVHRVTGTVLMVAATVNLFLGIDLGYFAETTWRIVVICSVVLFAVVSVVLAFMPQMFSESVAREETQDDV